MTDKITLALVLSILLAAAASIATAAERILLPVVVRGEPLAGGYGSLWATSLALTNTGETNLRIGGIENTCRTPGCPSPQLRPDTTVFAVPIGPGEDVPGTFITILEGDAANLNVTLRAQDLSRQELTWGTTIPAIPQSEAFTERLVLSDIPTQDRFRVLIRIYDYEPQAARHVRVRFLAIDPNRTLPEESFEEEDIVLRELLIPLTVPLRDPFDPGYAQIQLSEIPEITTADRIRIEIETLSPFPFWAFASVTNNETQHVTVVTP